MRCAGSRCVLSSKYEEVRHGPLIPAVVAGPDLGHSSYARSVPGAVAQATSGVERMSDRLDRLTRRQPRAVAIQASTSDDVRGRASDRLREPSVVTRMSSSIRMPMPRISSGTSRSSAWK